MKWINGQFVLDPKDYYTTQEEDTLSAFVRLHPDNYKLIEEQLVALSKTYALKPPKGNDSDFKMRVYVEKAKYFKFVHIRGPEAERIYNRVWSLNIKNAKGEGLYVCIVAGPNASTSNTTVKPGMKSPNGVLNIQSVARSTDPRLWNYDFFCKQLKVAINAQLRAMHENGVTDVVGAPLSMGLYKGDHDKIHEDISYMYLEIISQMQAEGKHFYTVMIPGQDPAHRKRQKTQQ